ncbi:UNVERIFIED_CONTAM: hypothetical protein K2H54_029742 [Gekko kuhli]
MQLLPWWLNQFKTVAQTYPMWSQHRNTVFANIYTVSSTKMWCEASEERGEKIILHFKNMGYFCSSGEDLSSKDTGPLTGRTHIHSYYKIKWVTTSCYTYIHICIHGKHTHFLLTVKIWHLQP